MWRNIYSRAAYLFGFDPERNYKAIWSVKNGLTYLSLLPYSQSPKKKEGARCNQDYDCIR